MADTIPVRAVPGRLFLGNRQGEYVGYKRCEPSSPDAVHRMANTDVAYALSGVVHVKDCADVRRAIAKGDLERAEDGPPTTSQKAVRPAKED